MIDLPPVIFFDLDDTILDDTSHVDRCWHMACERYAGALGLRSTELFGLVRAYGKWYWSDPDRHRAGRIHLDQTRREIVDAALRSVGIEAREIACQLADHSSALRYEMQALLPGALDTLRELRRRAVRLALITNGSSEVQREKIARFALGSFFEHIQIEGEFGLGKPDERVYRHVLAQMQTAPGDVWMVGDHLEWDIAAPQRLGMVGIWRDQSGAGLPAASAVQPDRIVRSIAELVGDPPSTPR